MFYQLHSAVEGSTAQSRNSTDAPSVKSSATLSSSVDVSPDPSTSSQLADSVSNLRKSLTGNRTGPLITKSTSLPVTISDKPRRKLNLEERLRASLSAADISTTLTSSLTTQSEIPALEEELTFYAASIPIPDSPVTSSVAPQGPVERPEVERSDTKSETQAHKDTETDSEVAETLGIDGKQTTFPCPASSGEGAGVKSVDGKVPVSNNELTLPKDTQNEEDDYKVSKTQSEELQECDTVEVLQRRLKEVEQRFSGKFLLFLYQHH